MKNSSYNTILELAGTGKVIGLLTKEYVKETDFEKYNLVELKTSISLGKIEFGIYINNNRFKELKDLITIIKVDIEAGGKVFLCNLVIKNQIPKDIEELECFWRNYCRRWDVKDMLVTLKESLTFADRIKELDILERNDDDCEAGDEAL